MAIPIPHDDPEAEEILANNVPIKPGTYNAVVDEVEESTVQSEQSDHYGKPTLKMTFKLTDEPYKNRKAWKTFIANGKPLGFMITALMNLGVPREQIGGDFESSVLVGRPCRLTLGYEKGASPDDGALHRVNNVLKPTQDQQAASLMP